MEQEKREMLFKIVTNDDIEKLQIDIQKQIVQEKRHKSPKNKVSHKLEGSHLLTRSMAPKGTKT